MSLKAFHVFFIVASGVLALWFGVWCFDYYGETEQRLYLVGSGLCVSVFVGLGFYMVWFLKKLKQIPFLSFLVAISLLLSQATYACPVCYGDPNSPLVKSAAAGVWFLLGTVGGVLSLFAALFGSWIARARRVVT